MAKQSTKQLVGRFLMILASLSTLSCAPGLHLATADDVVAHRAKCVAVPHLTVHPAEQLGDQSADSLEADEAQAEQQSEMVLRRLLRRETTRQHGIKAREILDSTRDLPFGSAVRFEIDGERYAAVIEKHYHEPGGEARPWGWHRGISLFAVVPVG